MIKDLDAVLFGKMIVSGANNLENNKKMIDALNVFHVPDGDTGTNMSLTFLNAAKELRNNEYETISEAAEVVAMATLRGARGNSGVILSQIFRGLARSFRGLKTIDTVQFAQALKLASDTAYRAVMKPTEGTILTIIRQCANRAVDVSEKCLDFTQLFDEFIQFGQQTLDQTPDMLPALKQAGVVDAGGKGLLCIFEGAFYTLKFGELIVLSDKTVLDSITPKQAKFSTEDIEFTYCTEFIINKSSLSESTVPFSDSIQNKGDSMIVIDEQNIVKVHIHTNNPGFVIEQAIKLGELQNIKIDNMKLQHENILADEPEKVVQPPKEYGIIAVAAGEGVCSLLKDLGADLIIEGGQTMNPSTEDILDAVQSINANHIIILPNNKNIILAAEQAKTLIEKPVSVIPTRSIPQGISAIIAFDPAMSPDENQATMTESAKFVKTGQITYAVRDTVVDDKNIQEGDILGIADDTISFIGKDVMEIFKNLVHTLIDEKSSVITVLYGLDTSEQDADLLNTYLEEKYPDFDISIQNGGQPIYYYIISVE